MKPGRMVYGYVGGSHITVASPSVIGLSTTSLSGAKTTTQMRSKMVSQMVQIRQYGWKLIMSAKRTTVEQNTPFLVKPKMKKMSS